jgi:outer membrane protein
MKRIFVFAIVATMLSLPLSVTAQTEAPTIACVDLQRAMLESEKGKEAKRTLDNQLENTKKSISKEKAQLEKMKADLEKQASTMTTDARTEKAKQYQEKYRDYERMVADAESGIKQKNMELVQKIVIELAAVAREIGEKEKYTLVVDASQNRLLFASPTIDITNKVIAAYNESSGKKTPSPSKPSKKKTSSK